MGGGDGERKLGQGRREGGGQEERQEGKKTTEYSSLTLLNFHAVRKVVMREEMV